MYHTFF
jgi:hypothetical protein